MIQLYYHTIPVKFHSVGAYATWFEDRRGEIRPVFSFGADIYKCIFKAPHVGVKDCPHCDYQGLEFKCGGSCFDIGGIKA